VPDRSQVLLVDEQGHVLSTMAKLDAHEAPGHLHLAFSVFLFDGSGRLLVQKRASSKYHFPGIWANACCSHPEPGEDLVASAERRLAEELGVSAQLDDVGSFVYRAVDPVSGRVEHEFDHVLVGTLADGDEPRPAPDEVDAVEWVEPGSVLDAGPERGYAPWFAQAFAIARTATAGAAPG
jgi:isopentenyl-diphosphate delta-isomerase